MSNHKWFHENIARDIKRDGRSIACIGGEGKGEFNFAYTIGNQTVSLPELLVIGVLNGSFLNDLSQQMIDRGRAFTDGELVRLPGARLPMKAVVVGSKARDEYTIQAGQHFGTEDYAVLQILISDKEGRFPDEPGCQPPYSHIPVLRVLSS
jgi:hypothetical protein